MRVQCELHNQTPLYLLVMASCRVLRDALSFSKHVWALDEDTPSDWPKEQRSCPVILHSTLSLPSPSSHAWVYLNGHSSNFCDLPCIGQHHWSTVPLGNLTKSNVTICLTNYFTTGKGTPLSLTQLSRDGVITPNISEEVGHKTGTLATNCYSAILGDLPALI